MKPAYAFRMLFAVLLVLAVSPCVHGQGVLIPTSEEQTDFLRTYKFVLSQASSDYRFTNATMDTTLFPRWGEFSVYWATSGPNRGSFVFPDKLPSSYSSLAGTQYESYDWRAANHAAISFKAYAKTIAIFKSDIRTNGSSASWEAVYFRNLIDSYILGNISYYIGEREIDSIGLIWTTQLLVVPAFAAKGTDAKFYVDSIFTASPRLKNNLLAFLSRGGTIYTEGNAVYLIEKLGLLPEQSVDYSRAMLPDSTNSILLEMTDSEHPVAFTVDAAGTRVYAASIPQVTCGNAEVIARMEGTGIPVIFTLQGTQANNGRVICNTALPTVGGTNATQPGETTHESRQLQWTVNAMISAFATNIDVTRSVDNEIPASLSAGRNAASYDRCDTLEIRVRVRNLSDAAISGITVTEGIRDFFGFVDVRTPDVAWEFKKPNLTLSGISIPPHGEKIIVYRIATPDPEDVIHERVNNYISWANYIYASYCTTSYTDELGFASYRKYRNYVDMLFSARIVADADLNWKNFLGLYYQPFKVFMMMENKERTAAMGAEYVQYIPKDVPFYWTDKSIDIPILKTPGGKYVDVLRGSSDENNPEFDMDSDGHPDVWLDTASISPKNYRIEETEVYWLNPWEHLRTGDKRYYEDIDHDGLRAEDVDGDGIVDIEEPGDKIRVWKVTWDVGKMAGYQFFDPYCYYEIWVDPPDLVPMSAGVASAYGRLDYDVDGEFYPYSPNVHAPNIADTSWMHWMERDDKGKVIWKQLIWQKINNYEGFTFIDTAKVGYALKATDRCAGTVPQPHREFIAVLSLGGEEIDMQNPTPAKSEYSNINYTTIFGEKRNTPIRTTYTYYAPLPNPLQFEYVTNNFTITDPSGARVLQHLPAYGKANLTFDIDASTEYTYYWIRNAGHDVDFEDPSLAQEGVEELGDGVFGYMIYDIPKGMGGYKITLPKKSDGTYDINKIVQVDGKAYHSWLANPNTGDSIRILEDPFVYHVFIPQLLIPPALDDDNYDGVDDWIDDRGDRFQSSTGYLHDGFMIGNGEAYPNDPPEPFKDDIYGWVTSGWYAGADGAYGDDFFETLGKTHFTIKAEFEGSGREGSVDISKGGWLVVEEIFGGSPWVLFSHALSAYAEGVNYQLTSTANPTMARYGVDTVFVKHVIEDKGEPHSFDINFDPFTVSYGYGETTITTSAGGKDPCGLIEPSPNLSTIIDPARDRRELTLIPDADVSNPDLAEYPKTVEGNFLQVRIEVSNGSDENWINTRITPHIPAASGATHAVMSYVSYPRPLVPASVDPATGAVIRGGDDPRAFRTGWRFNQPEGEVLVKMGNELNLLQPSRRAYFVFLFEIDPSLSNGIYDIDFTIDGEMRHYDGTVVKSVAYDVPSCAFSIAPRDARGNVVDYQKLVIGQGSLENIRTTASIPEFRGLGNVRWSAKDVNGIDFDTLSATLPAAYSPATGVETIDLSRFSPFPTKDRTKLYVLEQGEVSSGMSVDALTITTGQSLQYSYDPIGTDVLSSKGLAITTVGPKLVLDRKIVEINGCPYDDKCVTEFPPGEEKEMLLLFSLSNQGTSIAENVVLSVRSGALFEPVKDALPSSCCIASGGIEATCSSLIPGETRQVLVRYRATGDACAPMYDSTSLVRGMTAVYSGSYALSGNVAKDVFTIPDERVLDLPAYDFHSERLVCSKPDAVPGENVSLYVKIANGPVAVKDVAIGFYAVINNADTLLLATQVLPQAGAYTASVVNAEVTVPDSAICIEFLARIDNDAQYGEFCEFNNVQSLKLPLRGLDWILDVGNFPNPMRDETVITYVLPRDVKELTLTLYGLDGQEVGRIERPSTDIGRHAIVWRGTQLAAGTYIYTFRGTDDRGETKLHSGRMVKL
ncbi:MAG: hypothetical protein IH600_02770 [Bacteroidetes bacterium]|nr:hypothetical protein [Bacteroidota bacterium]